MDIVPLVYVKNRKLHVEKEGNPVSLDEVLEQVDKDESIYFLDIDGIEKDKPNLCTYQKIPGRRMIWVDAGPRVLGDVVDLVMTGAANITVRRKLWLKLDIPQIREITENEIYATADIKDQNEQNTGIYLFHNVDGVVVFNTKNQIEADFKSGSFLKNLCIKYKIYAHESNPKNFSYWRNLGVEGLLIDLSKIKEFKKNGI